MGFEDICGPFLREVNRQTNKQTNTGALCLVTLIFDLMGFVLSIGCFMLGKLWFEGVVWSRGPFGLGHFDPNSVVARNVDPWIP